MSNDDVKLLITLSHASVLISPIIIPLIILLMKGNENKKVKYHALQALAYQLSFMIIWFILIFGTIIITFATVGISALLLLFVVPFAFLLMLAFIIYGLYAAYTSYTNDKFSYPFMKPIVDKFL